MGGVSGKGMETPRRPLILPKSQVDTFRGKRKKRGHYVALCNYLLEHGRTVAEPFTERDFNAVRTYLYKRGKYTHRRRRGNKVYLLWTEDAIIKE